MNRFAVLAASFLVLGLTACSKSHPPVDDSHAFIENWSPSSLQLRCPSGECPQGVGMMVVRYNTYDSHNISRCSATLIAPNRMVTNAHCVSQIWGGIGAYFFARVGEQTVYRRIIREIKTYDSGVAGIGRDLSIWELDSPIGELVPRQISRQVPNDMSQLTAFVSNFSEGSDNGQDWTAFELDKRVCQTHSHQEVLNGGVEDKHIGLALFGCEIRHGNSGSAAFANGDLLSIQVVINSFHEPSPGNPISYGWPSSEPLPPDLGEFFAMGERVQCLPVDGENDPHPLCSEDMDAAAIY